MNSIFKNNILILINYLIFFIILLVIYNFDISQFAQFSNLTDQNRIPFKINPIDKTGYDGQFYIRLGLNPFDLNWSHEKLPENNLSYRYSRIGYPLILWFFSSFIKEYIIYISIFINVLGVLFIYAINRKNFELLHIDKNLAIFCAFLPGYYFVISRATSEIYEILFISLSILFFLKHKYFLFSLCIFFSILIRETAIIFYVAMILFCFFNKNNIKIYILFFPLIGFLLWQIFLFISFNNIPFGTGVNVNFSFPFWGILKILDLTRYQNNILQGITYISEYIFIFVTCLICFLKIKKNNIFDFLFLSFIAYFIYFLILNEIVLGTDWGFMRILLELNYFSTILILKSKSLNLKYVILVYGAINIFVFLRIVVEQFLKYNLILN